MEKKLKKLISIASPAICDELPQVSHQLRSAVGGVCGQLVELLYHKNGFFAFESALHLFPAGCRKSHIDLESWNREESWRHLYGDAINGYVFFAEDAFGEQFGVGHEGVYKFDPETGAVEKHAPDLEQWAASVLDNFEYETGYPLAREWQSQYGPLAEGKRLLPKIPFVLGGAYDVNNLYAADALEGMKFRADIWKQLRDLPNGTEVKLRIVN
jgi:hypothetical protein